MSNLSNDFNIDFNSGHAKLSQRKVAELLGVAQQNISKAVNRTGGDTLYTDLERETIIQQGFDGDTLSKLVAYYAFDSRQASVETKQRCKEMVLKTSAKGFQDFIDVMAGIPEPEPMETAQKILIGSWADERKDGIPSRVLFNDAVDKVRPLQQAKYTDRLYKELFGTTAVKLRELPLVDGRRSIGRNHLPEAIQIAAVSRAEFLAASMVENMLKSGYTADQISMTRVIALAGMTVRQTLNLNRMSSSKARGKVWMDMLKMDDTGDKSSLES